MNIIEAKNLTKVYCLQKIETPLFLNCNIEVKKGQFVVFYGPTGSGKTTLIKMLSALESPTKGKLTIANQDLNNLEDDEISSWRAETLGIIFQANNLIPNLTLSQNLSIAYTIKNQPEDREKKIAVLLNNLNLSDRRDVKARNLSIKEQQISTMGRAFIGNPPIILADDPGAELDKKSAHKIISNLFQYYQEHRPTVILTTDNEDYLKFADKLYSIKNYQLIEGKNGIA